MNVSPEYLNAICEGCLSPDRLLTAEITEPAIKTVFYEILHEVNNVEVLKKVTLRLCFECKGHIQQFVRFKLQVIDAHRKLAYHVKFQEKSNYNSTQSEINLDINNSSTNEQNPSVASDGSATGCLEPVTFIKVEDSGVDDADACFVDDGYCPDVADDKELTAPVKLDNEESIKSDPQNKSKQEIENEFNESDEEPLNNIKKEVDRGRGKRAKKRKKKNDACPKPDRRKCPGPRREKPAGVVDNARVRKKLEQLNVQPGQLEMIVLSWEEVEAERAKALSSEVFTRHRHRCYQCALGFNHQVKLDNHMKKHDPSAGAAVCTVCGVHCRDTHALAAHRRRHRVRWRCCSCGALVSRADVAADHVWRAHAAAAPTHTCTLCGHTAPTLGKLRNHLKNHSERVKCELCGKTFRDRTSLRTHLFIHRGEKEYSCPHCEKRFLFKKAMELHLITHTAPAHLYCHQCDMTFKNHMSYTQHIKYSLKHVDPAKLKYVCEVCDKKFLLSRRLEEHRLAVHLKVTPIACTVPGCHFACSSRPVLRTHLRVRHRGVRARRDHVCHACGNTYTSKKTLEGHLRSHTGERPFSCALCPSRFGYEAALYNHNKLVHLKPKLGRNRPPQPPPPVPPTGADVP